MSFYNSSSIETDENNLVKKKTKKNKLVKNTILKKGRIFNQARSKSQILEKKMVIYTLEN